MQDGSANDAPGDERGQAIDRLGADLAELRRRVALLEQPVRIRTQLLEIIDDNGAIRARLGYLGDEDVVGLECRRTNGSLSSFFGHVAGEGSVMMTGGAYDAFVLEFGTSERGAHLRVFDPRDPDGDRFIDTLAPERLGPFPNG